ncbi:MAG: alpha/beta fold hydrolase [Kiritimatiellae bacterium]|nr:alpha/beta fold hydrolase [Kiritimatiellia bacterium]
MKVFVLNGWASNSHAWDQCRFPRERIFSYVELLDGVAEEVLLNENEFVLVGWSMGGSYALRYAMRFPERLKGLVLLAATPRMMRDENWAGMTPRRVAALELGTKMGNGGIFVRDSDENLSRGLDYLKETDLRRELVEFSESGGLKCPVYIFQSVLDGIVRADNAKFLGTVFPNAHVEMIEGGGHALSVAIPEKIDAAVGAILSRSVF